MADKKALNISFLVVRNFDEEEKRKKTENSFLGFHNFTRNNSSTRQQIEARNNRTHFE